MHTGRFTIWSALLAISALVSGCLSSGRKVSDDAYARVQAGITTRGEVDSWLGRPSDVTEDEGRVIYRYAHSKMVPYDGGYGSVGLRVSSRDILFETNEVVLKKHSFSGRTVVRQTGLVSVGTVGTWTGNETNGITAGRTTAFELKRRFGEPLVESLMFDGTIYRAWGSYRQNSPIRSGVTMSLNVWFNEHDEVFHFSVQELKEP